MAGFDPISLAIEGGAAVIGAITSAIGAAVAEGDYEKARQLREEALSNYGDAIAPKLDRSVAQEVGPTALASIQVPTETRDTQVSAMRKLSDLYDKGGMGTGDEAALQIANQGAQQRAGSDYQSLQQNLAARGQTGNPALAAALASKSSGDVVNATATNRYQAQADARNRAMQALGMSADIGSRVGEQDYGRAAGAATAADRINQFNAGQRTGASNENARRAESQYQMNVGDKERKRYAGETQANGYQQRGDRTRGTAAGIGNAITTLGAGVGGSMGGGSSGAPGGGAPAWQDPSESEWDSPYRKGGR